MTQLIQRLLSKTEDPSFHPQHPNRKPGIFVIPRAEGATGVGPWNSRASHPRLICEPWIQVKGCVWRQSVLMLASATSYPEDSLSGCSAARLGS